jgi:hypothetical protein
MKFWEIIADDLRKARCSWDYVSALDRREGRTIWIADAHRGDGKRFVVRADEKLTAFVELESAIQFSRWLACVFESAFDQRETAELGLMFWFSRRTFSGSYLRLISARRA